MKKILVSSLFAGMLALTNEAFAMDGDVAAGEKVFKKCKACHVVDSEDNKVGPSLKDVFGRQPGVAEGFKFSKNMVAYGEGKVWDDENMAAYIAAPKKVVKGTKMSFAGLKKEEDIANVLAYLKQFSEPAN